MFLPLHRFQILCFNLIEMSHSSNSESIENGIIGFIPESQQYILHEKGRIISVPKSNIQLNHSPRHRTCKKCQRSSYHHTHNELVSGFTSYDVKRKQYGTMIQQNQFIIAPIKDKSLLYTLGLATCVALQFDIKLKGRPSKSRRLTHTFLSHISAKVDVPAMVDQILKSNIERIANVKIYAGVGGAKNNKVHYYQPSDASFKKAIELLAGLAENDVIIPDQYKVIDVCYAEMVPLRRTVRKRRDTKNKAAAASV